MNFWFDSSADIVRGRQHHCLVGEKQKKSLDTKKKNLDTKKESLDNKNNTNKQDRRTPLNSHKSPFINKTTKLPCRNTNQQDRLINQVYINIYILYMIYILYIIYKYIYYIYYI